MFEADELFFFQAEDGIRDAQESRGLGDVYKRQQQELMGKTELDLQEQHSNLPGQEAILKQALTQVELATAEYNKARAELADHHHQTTELHTKRDQVFASLEQAEDSGVRAALPVSYTHLTLPTKRIV
eukprot:TRINITY_DN46990_c0_g1_i1.p1 TRINITY_DN46990_c0_g1~~TRINITY_DN46990_c0_g1_i1.p1  ORF type:complete len:128 (-),score=51.30 TRINITY_DN46990_c0_g1_i1:80-463(-)